MVSDMNELFLGVNKQLCLALMGVVLHKSMNERVTWLSRI